MKLLLTSAGWWKEPKIGKEFLKLVDKKPAEIKVFLVFTPLKDFLDNKYIKRILRQFKEVGILKENITFFQLNKKVKKEQLKEIDVIYVLGGNTFDYLNGIRKTGLNKKMKEFVKKGGIYVGLSAGSYIACPTIEAATWKHADNNKIGLKNLKGLNLVSFLMTAHFEKKYRKTIKEAAKNTKYLIIALTDKQAILIKNKQVKIIGTGKKNIFNTKNRL
ncbi:MAG: Type 1 glutamine amidotransferase-like domain-containing protein [Candidatus Pacebacteria bacterium]|nr:Type 1 glutamine amidotransferase-like domain-containing protein [Candidatus Paceibacterota bacterium]